MSQPDNREICQSCGQPIDWFTKVIAVRYGEIRRTVKHTAVSKGRVDYFHENCDPAFTRSPDKDKQ